MFKTDSPVFITNFIEECRHKEIDFTEFIIIGGDGLFSQLINAIHQHPEDDLIKTMPIGLIPGGSTNSLC
jgi:diacylglycerol kinase family enzyme